jgi:elongation factor Ts
VHANHRIGVLVEVNCETDFVALNDDFQEFARDVAIQIAATAPRWVSEEEVPAEMKDAERAVFEQQAQDKPAEVRPKIAEGRLRKWLDEVVLLGQEHVNTDKYEGRTIEQIRAELAAKTGENVVIRRFVRFELGR